MTLVLKIYHSMTKNYYVQIPHVDESTVVGITR